MNYLPAKGRGIMLRRAGNLNPPNEVTKKHLDDFFSLKEVEPVVYVGTATGGLGILKEVNRFDEAKERRLRDQNYAERYQNEEERELTKQINASLPTMKPTMEINAGCNVTLSQLSEIDEPSEIEGIPVYNDLNHEDARELYAKYQDSFDMEHDKSLLIAPYKQDILKLVSSNPVVVIQGSTGSGKTTQVPQYILDDFASKGIACKIAITQPRRIAAVSIANRVSQERRLQPGTLIGYQIGMDSQTTPDTRITYMTTGVLLQKLINNKNMTDYTHIIIDEIHERDQNTDLIMMIVRKFLRTNSRSTKIILMSATIDTEIYSKYFSSPLQGRLMLAPVLNIPGKSRIVSEFYLDQLSSLGKIPKHDPGAPSIEPECYEIVFKLISTFDRIENMEEGLTANNGLSNNRGTVLIFLPGYEFITEMKKTLTDPKRVASNKKWWILPLHSSITADEQKRVFKHPQDGFRKIIISTNIAESSITVTDIKYVIDFCLTKSLVCDPNTNYVSLQLEWAAKANCNQRKGRAGRVSDGRVYRMVTQTFYESSLRDYAVPEMKRCPLELVVLNAKKLNMGEPKAILALCLDPPALVDIEKSILTLKEVGALKLTVNGSYTPYDGDMTFVGHVMAILPIEVKLSKLILLGFAFDCLEECIIIAASLSVVNFFSKPFQKLLESYQSRLSWADGSFSDCLSFLSAYSIWNQHCETNFFKRPGGISEEHWAANSFLQLNRLREVKFLIEEIKRRLHPVGINFRRVIPGQKPREVKDNSLILMVALCGAFYPNYFVQEENDEKEIYKVISKKSPLNTVYVKGLPVNQGILYEQAIMQLFEPCSQNVKIDFEDSKALIQFGDLNPSIISPAVYMAVKMRQIRMELPLYVYNPIEAKNKLEILEKLKIEHCQKKGILRSNRISLIPSHFTLKKNAPPSLAQITVHLKIVHVMSCGHFYAQYTDSSQVQVQTCLDTLINMYEGKNLKPLKSKPEKGMLILAQFQDEEGELKYYRGFIKAINQTHAQVFFVDFGNTANIPIKELRDIGDELDEEILSTPVQAVECFLSEIKPKVGNGSKSGEWSDIANHYFSERVHCRECIAAVYSVVQNSLRLELNIKNEDDQYESINKDLIQRGYAELAEEDYNSKQNHELRQKCEQMEKPEIETMNKTLNLTSDDFVHLSAPDFENDDRQRTSKIFLKGPHSPLEVFYIGMTHMASLKRIKIEQDSVNSVTLDSEPQNRHNRMLVASYVCLNSTGNSIKVRNTTLMPRINGLPSIMSLLFAPSVEYRPNTLFTKYAGVICGLGYDKTTRQSYYPEHDSEITFDIVLDKEDTFMINSIRICMNILLGNSDNSITPEIGYGPVSQLQEKARDFVQRLLSKVRKFQEPITPKYPFKWGLLPEENKLKTCVDDLKEVVQIFPAHDLIFFPLEDKELKLKKLVELDNLHSRASRSNESIITKCSLCDVTTLTPSRLLMHLHTEKHKSIEAKLRLECEEESD